MVILGTGKSVVKALEVLKQHSVEDRKVIVLTLFATPESKLIGCVTFPICVCIECWAYGHEIRSLDLTKAGRAFHPFGVE